MCCFSCCLPGCLVGSVWQFQGEQALLAAQSISKGAVVGMIANMICAVAASYFIIRQGHWKGILSSLAIWMLVSLIIFFQ
nr:DUF3147 family protein [Desulforamulus aquiferis]